MYTQVVGDTAPPSWQCWNTCRNKRQIRWNSNTLL